MNNNSSGIVGFIGLGVMGREMARNLTQAGYTVRAFDVVPAAGEVLRQFGVDVVSDLVSATRDADIVISMLPDTPQVEEIVRGEGGLLSHPPRGKLFVDMSTIAPAATRQLSDALLAVGVTMLDAPVSGGPVGAKNGTLTIMVGGDAEGYSRATPYLSAMGTTLNHVGASGAGQTVKLCNQLICGINIQAICEALALARAWDINLPQMREVLMGGSAASWMLDKLGSSMIEGDASAGFRIDLMMKDLRLVLEAAQKHPVPLPATALVATQYQNAQAYGEGANGNQALFKVYDRLTGQKNSATQ
ncbi:NAD(P)-dependent oxidoreductase [Pantoea sp. GM01]|uniref:NAD(P)-dependent oxidoreductase n=1 Tax=Pantoea sp. GM01 TaxID=1144320 RepID=UPI000270E8F3|nr:NAD(P)-dependent oxidoreductase [Pantoea sp. GM01]EJL93126.1 beta-hydroxyacid dehydrogenase, 3-hydroxyisobutyrate dehydrogenase [Pantoea sp. GM01]